MRVPHLVLVVLDCSTQDYLVDLGFGRGGPGVPLALEDSVTTRTPQGEVFQLRRGDLEQGEEPWLLWQQQEGEWALIYSFDHHSAFVPCCRQSDFYALSYFTCHWPESRFHSTRFATLSTPDGRWSALNNSLKLRLADGGLTEVVLTDAEHLRTSFWEHLHIRLSLAEAAIIFNANAAAA